MTGLVAGGARLIDASSGETLAGAALDARIGAVASAVDGLPAGVLFARTSLDAASALRWAGAFRAGRAVALLDPGLDTALLASVVERFRPAAVLGAGDPPPGSYRSGEVAGPAWVRTDPCAVSPHPDLALLLPTSGSTGSPKMVRLSRSAVLANAASIAEALDLGPGEVAPTSLPLHYSYGLSVLNSHLLAGATVLVEGSGLMGRPFWEAVAAHGATSLAGVPYHYEILRRLKFSPARYPRLRTLTQAGGRLAPERVAAVAAQMAQVGGRLFVMYGQTEATARMAVLPPDRLGEKPGSAGVAIPGGRFRIEGAGGPPAGGASAGEGEIVYEGPNVMMGYAESEEEVAGGDELAGVLRTGDLGTLDAEGFLFVTGRAKRIGKLYGVRVNLDDLEHWLAGYGPVAVVGSGDRIVAFLAGAATAECAAAAQDLAARLHSRSDAVDVRGVDALPYLGNGKVDYRFLEAAAGG